MELIVRLGDRLEEVHLERHERGYRVRLGEAAYDVDLAVAAGGLHSLLVDGRQYEVVVARARDDRYLVSAARGAFAVEVVDPLTHLARQSHGDEAARGGQQVTAYMPGRVVDILVAEGDTVEAGQGILVLEAMKMKNEIQAETGGVVKKLFVEQDQAVEGGDPLFLVE